MKTAATLAGIALFGGFRDDGSRVQIAVLDELSYAIRMENAGSMCLPEWEWTTGYYNLNFVSGHLTTWTAGYANFGFASNFNFHTSQIQVSWFSCWPFWVQDGVTLDFIGVL